jgi:hypothetical protein
MTEEDEEFQRLEREAEMRRIEEDDDDTQVYKKPWVGLTDEEVRKICVNEWGGYEQCRAIEAKLKEKNA